MLILIILSGLLLAVAIFALENAQAVTVRFLYWELQSSVAVVTLAATAAGVDRWTGRGGEPPAALEAWPGRDRCASAVTAALCTPGVGQPLLRRGD